MISQRVYDGGTKTIVHSFLSADVCKPNCYFVKRIRRINIISVDFDVERSFLSYCDNDSEG